MTKEKEDVWIKIKDFELDDLDSSLTLSKRLASENGWSLSYSILATIEYKKFIFLLWISDVPLTPSDQVDQVWHLHLLFTTSYWKNFCGNLLKKEIHHGPTEGGGEELDKFSNWHEKTKLLCMETFNEIPPKEWPSEKLRFTKINFRRVNLSQN